MEPVHSLVSPNASTPTTSQPAQHSLKPLPLNMNNPTITNNVANVSPSFPKDAQILALIMKSLDIHECEASVIPLLLEFFYRHAMESLHDAFLFADHLGHFDVVSLNELRYAIQTRANHNFVPPPSREMMMELAVKKNALPLPLISDERYIRLPPEEYCCFGQQSHIVNVSALKSSQLPLAFESSSRPEPSFSATHAESSLASRSSSKKNK